VPPSPERLLLLSLELVHVEKEREEKKFIRIADISNVPKENNKTMSNCFTFPSEKACMFKQALQKYLPCSL